MNDWKQEKLINVCTKVTDGTHDSPKSVLSGGYPLIKGTEISDGFINFKACEYISKSDHLNVISRSKPELGDTLFTNIGNSIGDCAYIDKTKEFSIKNVALFKPNKKIIYPKFLFYIIKSAQFQGEILNKISGSAQPFASLHLLRNQNVSFPSIALQKKIVNILSKYEDHIQNNAKQIKLLKQNIKLTFEEWFLRFKIQGEKLKVDTNTGLPFGWKKVLLTKYIDLEKGIEPGNSNYEYKKTNNNVLFLRVGDLSKRESSIYVSKDKINNKIVNQNDILISLDGSPGITKFGLSGSYSTGIRKAVTKKKNLSNVFIFNQLNSTYIKKLIESHASGTTILHAGSAVKKMKFYLPPDNILDLYNKNEMKKFNLIINLLNKNKNLEEIFNILFIRLMKGIINIKNIDILKS